MISLIHMIIDLCWDHLCKTSRLTTNDIYKYIHIDYPLCRQGSISWQESVSASTCAPDVLGCTNDAFVQNYVGFVPAALV